MDPELEYPLPPREREFLDSAKSGDVPRLKELLNKGVPVDVLDNRDSWCWGQTALMYAASGGHVEAARFLLHAGAKLSAKDRGSWDAEHDRQPLHYAMPGSESAAAEVLLDAGANPNAISYLGCTPLSVAIEADNANAVELLLKRGADVNLKPRTKRYIPPVHSAVAERKPHLLRMLLKAGTDPDAPNHAGETALMYASFATEELAITMIRNLLDAGAKVGRSANGATPLFRAVIAGNHGAARELLRAGADPNLIYESQQGTVLDVVKQRIRTHENDGTTELGRQLLQQWQAMFLLLRQHNSLSADELR